MESSPSNRLVVRKSAWVGGEDNPNSTLAVVCFLSPHCQPLMSLTPRSHKRKVVPILAADPDEEELQPVPSLPASPAPAPAPAAEPVKEDAPKDKEEEEGFSPEEEERYRIWDMFAEEYHDSEWLPRARRGRGS